MFHVVYIIHENAYCIILLYPAFGCCCKSIVERICLVYVFTKAEKHAYQIDDCEAGKDTFLITLLGCPWHLVNGCKWIISPLYK